VLLLQEKVLSLQSFFILAQSLTSETTQASLLSIITLRAARTRTVQKKREEKEKNRKK
jgi:hypothetical protein